MDNIPIKSFKKITYEDLVNSLEKGEYISSFQDRKERMILSVVDQDNHTKRIFVKTNHELEELNADAIIEEIANYLKEKVNVKAFLKDAISVQTDAQILNLFARIESGKAKVKADDGCYKLKIYGQRGKPFTLWLREP